jgi:hypothetical protein
MATGNSINANGSGIAKYDGAGTWSTTTTTQHNALVGGTSNAIVNVAPTATAGVPLVSNGSSSDPSFSTALIAGGGTASTSFTTNGVVVSGATSTTALTAIQLTTNGGLIIGGTTPAEATLTAGTGISIVNASNSITINSTGGGLTWSVVTGTSQSAAINNGYFTNNVGLVTVTLPTTAAVGTVQAVSGMGAGGWKIAQNALQQIFFGITTTTAGTGGSLASTQQYDAIEMVCNVANTSWVVQSVIGNITVV